MTGFCDLNMNDSISSTLAHKEEEEDSIGISRDNYSCFKHFYVNTYCMVYDG